jgi:hypothetical protein
LKHWRARFAIAAIPFGMGCACAWIGPGCAASTGYAADDGAVEASGDDAPSFGGDGRPPPPPCTGLRCSGDLHSFVDCSNQVVQTCPADQGCTPSGCIPACDAARANKSSVGCEYYSVNPDIWIVPGGCLAAFVANTWSTPVAIALDRGGVALDAASATRLPAGSGASLTYDPLPSSGIPPGKVAIVFLSHWVGSPAHCPDGVTPAVAGSPEPNGTRLSTAFHITTSAPVVAYDIAPYGGGSAAVTGATLLLPVSAWDTNYVALDAYRPSVLVPNAYPSLDIVAAEDGTNVTILPTATVAAGAGVAGADAGTPHTYALSRGQVLQITQPAELSGSPIQSDKPIGVWAAHQCMNVQPTDGACDAEHEQLPPVRAFGHEYVAVRYRNRVDNGPEEAPPWRLVGAVAGTSLTYDPGPAPDAPASLDVGQIAEFRAPGPFVVRSQDDSHVFYLAGTMMGGTPYSTSRGDPELVNVIPPQQYLSYYAFFTDPTYPETNLVVVRTASGGQFQDVTLDCAGVLGGWQPVGSSGDYEYTRIDLVRHDFAPQNGCDNGAHEMRSGAPFGLTVWGWGSEETMPIYTQAVSYAYPAGASVQPINMAVVPPVPK